MWEAILLPHKTQPHSRPELGIRLSPGRKEPLILCSSNLQQGKKGVASLVSESTLCSNKSFQYSDKPICTSIPRGTLCQEVFMHASGVYTNSTLHAYICPVVQGIFLKYQLSRLNVGMGDNHVGPTLSFIGLLQWQDIDLKREDLHDKCAVYPIVLVGWVFVVVVFCLFYARRHMP